MVGNDAKKAYTGNNKINSAKKNVSSGDRLMDLLVFALMPCWLS